MPILIHGIVEMILTLLIIILEIASLVLSTYSATGAGIWCGIPFMIAAISTIMLGKFSQKSQRLINIKELYINPLIFFILALKWERSRVWASRVFIAQIVLLVFTFILLGIVGSFISANSTIYSSYSSLYSYSTTYGKNFQTKYQVMQAQLAFAIILMFCGWAYLIYYCIVTYLALWRPFNTLDTPHLLRE